MKQSTPTAKRSAFRIHAIVFALTLALLAAINLLTGAPYWSAWVIPPWTIGLLAHWFFVLGPGAAKADHRHDAPVSHHAPRHKGGTRS